MRMDWNEEFLKALASFDNPIDEPLEYRLHYDDEGNIILCSMQQHPQDTKYLVVDKQTYDNYFRYRYNKTKKQLEKIDIYTHLNVKLKKSSQGHKVVKGHAGIVLEPDESYQKVEYYQDV